MGNKKNYQNENVKRMMEIYNRQKDSRVKKTKNILGKIRKAARNVIITVLSAGTVVGVNAALDSSESARADLQSTTSSPEAGGTNNILWSSSQEKCGFCVKNGQENYELVKGSAVKEAYNAAKKAGNEYAAVRLNEEYSCKDTEKALKKIEESSKGAPVTGEGIHEQKKENDIVIAIKTEDIDNNLNKDGKLEKCKIGVAQAFVKDLNQKDGEDFSEEEIDCIKRGKFTDVLEGPGKLSVDNFDIWFDELQLKKARLL